MKREPSIVFLVTVSSIILLLLIHADYCDGSPLPASTKSIASSLLRRRGSKPKSSSSSSNQSFCLLPHVTPGAATCFASFRRWTYSAELGKCEEIYYGGCFGTKNLFDSYEECKKACGGVGVVTG